MKKAYIKNYLFIFIGVILISYPFISDLVGKFTQTQVISEYKKNINILSNTEKDEQIEKAIEYNDNLINKEDEKTYNDYMNVLNISNVIAYINIPKINVYLPVYHGVSENILQSGVGHVEGTSLPIGGIGTHSVLAAHTGLAKNKMFDDIKKLEIGDRFFIYVLDKILVYEVDNIKVVLPDDVSSIGIDENKDYVTLVTCTPFMINTHRLLVRGKRVSSQGTFQDEENNITEINDTDINIEKIKEELYLKIIIFLLLILILVIITHALEKRNRKIIDKIKGVEYDELEKTEEKQKENKHNISNKLNKLNDKRKKTKKSKKREPRIGRGI